MQNILTRNISLYFDTYNSVNDSCSTMKIILRHLKNRPYWMLSLQVYA